MVLHLFCIIHSTGKHAIEGRLPLKKVHIHIHKFGEADRPKEAHTSMHAPCETSYIQIKSGGAKAKALRIPNISRVGMFETSKFTKQEHS